MRIYKLFFLLIFLTGNIGYTQIRFPAWFGDHMVLQQKSEVKLWGWSEKGEKANIKITTSWDNEVYKTNTNDEGVWQQIIKTSCAGGPYQISVTDESGEYNLKDIMLGEVWLCSGQSNMAMPMKGMRNQPILNSEEIIAESSNENLRLFTVTRAYSDKPEKDLKGRWDAAKPETVKDFSAVGYQFGKMIQEELDIPVGIIVSSWGGTPIRAWMNSESLEEFKSLRKKDSTQKHRAPSVLYNAMIAPLRKFPVSGFLWYQGENDRWQPEVYEKALPEMVSSWRDEWDQDDLPFLYVQIAPFTYGRDKKLQSPYMREAQLKALEEIPNSSIAITADIGSNKTIHPPNKTLVATRLAKAALAMKYGRQLNYKSPALASYEIDGDKIILSFTNAESLELRDSDTVNFEIAGEDKVFFPAEVMVEGNKIILESNRVKEPVAARYGFKNYFEGNLFNSDELPVAPFRTDKWKTK